MNARITPILKTDLPPRTFTIWVSKPTGYPEHAETIEADVYDIGDCGELTLYLNDDVVACYSEKAWIKFRVEYGDKE